MKTEHKYAQVLRWIANGIGEEVQVRETSRGLDWEPLLDHHDLFMAELIRGESANNWEFRIKPRTVMCNSVEVPAPESVAPIKTITFYTPDVAAVGGVITRTWFGTAEDLLLLEKGLVYLDAEVCIARTKAMLLTQPC